MDGRSSSSTSSSDTGAAAVSDAAWRRCWRTLVWTALVFGAACYALVLVMDPYQNVPFSPPLDRAPVDTNQRFAYPALARHAGFEGALFGTSTARLLDPVRVGAQFDARFANLSMNGATAWEQAQLAHLYLRHHPHARFVLLGLDVVWCETGARYEKFTFRLFPHWMYDDNRWNDLLYLFNDKALEQAVRQIEYQLGAREAKYRIDGYRYFLPPEQDYDLARAREKIYGRADFDAHAVEPPPPAHASRRRATLRFPTHELLAGVLESAPAAATKVLFFVPYHAHVLRSQAERYAECKGRVTDLAARFENTHVIDFMFPSALTRDDANYWDSLHYRQAVAGRLERLLPQALARRRDAPDLYRYLTPAAVLR